MKNYIIVTPYTTKCIINQNTVHVLKNHAPKNCPFINYTYFDLLKDFISMYSYMVSGKILLSDFIKMLQRENYIKAIVYGNDIINILEN